MSMRMFVDETKAKNYLVVGATVPETGVELARKELRALVLPGQRGLHMKDEDKRRRGLIADAITSLNDLGVQVRIYDAGRNGTERIRRGRALAELIGDAAGPLPVRITLDRDATLESWDRQTMIELTRAAGHAARITYGHESRHNEMLLAIPDAVAWCWARGGEWRSRVRPIVAAIKEV